MALIVQLQSKSVTCLQVPSFGVGRRYSKCCSYNRLNFSKSRVASVVSANCSTAFYPFRSLVDVSTAAHASVKPINFFGYVPLGSSSFATFYKRQFSNVAYINNKRSAVDGVQNHGRNNKFDISASKIGNVVEESEELQNVGSASVSENETSSKSTSNVKKQSRRSKKKKAQASDAVASEQVTVAGRGDGSSSKKGQTSAIAAEVRNSYFPCRWILVSYSLEHVC